MTGRQIEHLVRMANQIALNLGAECDVEAAVRGTREHLSRFWTSAMREQLLAHWRGSGEGLHPAVAAVMAAMEEHQ